MTTINKSKKMPLLFLGHGSPMNAIQNNRFTEGMQFLGKELPTPKAILVISAHWETKGVQLTSSERPRTIHDFYGFPQELFEVQYPASGSQEVIKMIQDLIKDPTITTDKPEWGLDHGTWSLLRHMYPKANIPVVQLSLDRNQSMEFHFELGKKLGPLRERGVLILGSGNIVHNLREIKWGENAEPHDWAISYDNWVKEKIENRRFDDLIFNAKLSNEGQLSIPTDEHYLPLLYILGASIPGDKVIFDIEGIQNGSISMTSVRFS